MRARFRRFYYPCSIRFRLSCYEHSACRYFYLMYVFNTSREAGARVLGIHEAFGSGRRNTEHAYLRSNGARDDDS